MNSGVLKSGSPRLRAITSFPNTFNSLLILAIANVALSANLFILSETLFIAKILGTQI